MQSRSGYTALCTYEALQVICCLDPVTARLLYTGSPVSSRPLPTTGRRSGSNQTGAPAAKLGGCIPLLILAFCGTFCACSLILASIPSMLQHGAHDETSRTNQLLTSVSDYACSGSSRRSHGEGSKTTTQIGTLLPSLTALHPDTSQARCCNAAYCAKRSASALKAMSSWQPAGRAPCNRRPACHAAGSSSPPCTQVEPARSRRMSRASISGAVRSVSNPSLADVSSKACS